MQRPCTAPTLGVGEVAHETAQHVGARLVVGVEHHDDLAGRAFASAAFNAPDLPPGEPGGRWMAPQRGSRRGELVEDGTPVASSEPSSITMISRRSGG